MTWRFRPTFVFAKMAPKITALALSLILALAPTLASAQTSVIATPIPNAKQTFVDSNGKPFSGGKVYNYVPNTTVPKTTWSDTGETTPNSNPVTLDSAGRATIFGQGNYRQVLKDSAGNTIWDSFTIAPGSAAPAGATGTDTAPVGTVMPFAGLSIPTNWLLAYGQAISRSTYAQLLTAITIVNTSTSCTTSSTTISGLADTSQMRIGAPIEASCLPTGTTIATIASSTSITVNNSATSTGTVTSTVFPWGNGDGSLTFNVPDLRGRAVAGADAMGGTAASRLTSTYFGSNARAPGQGGGSQSHTLTAAESAVLSYTATAPTITGTYNDATAHVLFGSLNSGADEFFVAPSAANPFLSASASTPTVSSNAGGGAHAIVQPTLTFNYIIKVAPNTSGAGGVISIGGMFGDVLCGTGITCAAQTISNAGVLDLGGLTGSVTCGGGLTCSAGSISVTGFPTGVISFNGRTGAVVPAASDYAFSQLTGTATAAQLAAGAASTNVGALSGDLTGTLPAPTVAGLRGTPISSTAPTNGQSFIYDSGAGQYKPIYKHLSIAQYTPGGTANDTVGVQNAFNACAGFGGCNMICAPGVNYTVDVDIQIGSNTYFDGAGCTFKQRAPGGTGTDGLFQIVGKTNVHLKNLRLVGTATPGGGYLNGASGNAGIHVMSSSSRIWIENSDIREFLYFGILTTQSDHIYINGNYLYENFGGVSVEGSSFLSIIGNVVNRTILYTLTPVASQFTIGITLGSTDAVVWGPSTDVDIIGNTVQGLPYAQCIMAHAGQRIRIIGNNAFQCSVGISLNPFNMTDITSDVTVSGNVVTSTNAVTLPPGSADAGIVAGGTQGSTASVDKIAITGNTVTGPNNIVRDVAQGCFVLGFVGPANLANNVARGCGANGYVFNDEEQGTAVTGNSAYNVVAYSATQNGFLWLGAPRATMMSNMVSGLNGVNGIGYKVVGAVTNLKWKDSGSVLLNGTFDTTTASSP